MEITKQFKALVKTIKVRNKQFELDKSRILENPKPPSEFSKKSKTLLNNISCIRDFILEHRKEYLQQDGLVGEKTMNDIERDQIDTGTQQNLKTCTAVLRDFKKDSLKADVNSHTMLHCEGVVELLENYLKNVTRMYSEQKAIRVKRTIDRQKLSKLEPETRVLKTKCEDEKKDDAPFIPETKVSNTNFYTEEKNYLSTEEDFTPEELQKFEEENLDMFQELNVFSAEVKRVEKGVVKIAQLQEIFTENILEQQASIDLLNTTAQGTTENVKDANEEIREAMKNNAGLRVWVLFFLLVLGFTLLFLDWYND